MQTQQPDQTQQTLPLPQAAQPKVLPQPWVKPTFERAPLNEAQANRHGSGSADLGLYAS